MLKKYYPYLIILLITTVFFWKLILQNAVAMPGDLMSGAYYPWLEYKYGYAVGVPVKNGLISDVFSQFYIWKKLAIESYKSLNFPLWNPYSYSGYPLLANFHSGSLYLLNLLFIPFKFSTGWNLFVVSGILGSALSMFALLKSFKYKTLPSLIGAIAYSFSGYSIAWMQFATAGHSMIWIPLLLLAIENYFNSKKIKWLLIIPPTLFLLTTAGHFQIMVYGFIIAGSYCLFKYIDDIKRKLRDLVYISIAFILGVGMSSIQLLPTLELTALSVRFQEHYIQNINYGLLPLRNLVTLFAPDFFGNPATGNYWGFWNYHETMLYLGLPSLFALVWSITSYFKLDKKIKFFLFSAIITLLLSLDTPIGQAIYKLNVPGLSTSAAGRIIAIFTLSTSILLTNFVQNIRIDNLRKTLGNISPLLEFMFITLLVAFLLKYTYAFDSFAILAREKININIAIRNLAIPIFITGSLMFVIIINKTKAFYSLFILVMLFDLFRFGWKYTPFVPEKLVFPKTEVTDFLRSQPGIFRVDKVLEELMPPNTWAYYGLMSPSGYDPMALNSYSNSFHRDFSGSENASTRYAEIHSYDSEALGYYNVKYLLAVKRDEKALVPGDNINYKVDEKEWKRVFQSKAVAVLENTNYKERAFFDQGDGTATIVHYSPEKISIDYKTNSAANLILLDTWYPGWVASINKNPIEIYKYDEIFRKISVPTGEGRIEFEYKPKSFTIGLYTFIASFVVWVILLLLVRKDHRN